MTHHALAENPRTANKAAIRRAARKSQRDLRKIDKAGLAQITKVYRQAVADLSQAVDGHAGSDGSVRLGEMQDLLAQAQDRLNQLERDKHQILEQGRLEAAALGVQPWQGEAVAIGASLTQLADDALQFTQHFIAADGLQLSDRIWRNQRHTREVVAEAIQNAVIQGHSASQAAQDFIARGLPLPPEIARKATAANSRSLAKKFRNELMRQTGNPYDNALRLFRTEINRAHGEAFRAGAFEHPDVIGTRFLLSPNHPRPDICDLHASVNRYGLGKGVYPKGKSPWPAHPNTLSFEEVVFSDEVTPADRKGKETRLEWLKAQSSASQSLILNSRMKGEAFRRGFLTERQITTPWKVLKTRLDRRGVDYSAWKTTRGGAGSGLAQIQPPRGFEFATTVEEATEWAKQNNLADRVDYEKSDVRVANEWNKSIFEHITEFPELRENLKFIGTIQARDRMWYENAVNGYLEKLKELNPGIASEQLLRRAKQRVKRPRVQGQVWAQSWGDKSSGGVTVNKKWSKDYDQLKTSLKKTVESKFHPVGSDTVKSIIDHEMGHQLDTLLSVRQNPDIQKLYTQWIARDNDGSELSVYARKNIAEFIAEAWTEYRNNDQPRPLAVEVGRFIQRRYQEVIDAKKD